MEVISASVMWKISIIFILTYAEVNGGDYMSCENILTLPADDVAILTKFEAEQEDKIFRLIMMRDTGIYNLVLKFGFMFGPLTPEDGYSFVCLFLLKTEVETYLNESLQAYVIMATNEDIPVGVFVFNNKCLYGGKKKLVECGTYVFIRDMVLTSVFMSSPLQEEFWRHLQDERVFHHDWIKELAIANFQNNSVPSLWTRNLRLSKLLMLTIAGNTWEHPEDFLGYLPRLKLLHLLRNNIKTLPDDMFRNFPSLEVLNLNFNKLESLPHGMPNITVLDVSNQSSSVMLIHDEVIPSLTHLETLTINTRMEVNLTNIFRLPHLKSLYCNKCMIRDIETQENSSWVNDVLYRLDMGSNNLSSLPAKIFENLSNLSILRLDNNTFNVCPCDILNTIKQLQHLNLSKNYINEIHPYCFSELSNLTSLDLSWNMLSVLKSSAFENVKNLLYLNLSHNALHSIQEFAFPDLIRLLSLDISFNNLTEAPYLQIYQLEKLDLSHNRMRRVNSSSVKHISLLDLNRNNITELQLGEVTMLNLSYNGMEYISDDMWSQLEGVNLLDLGMNHFLCCHSNFTVLQSRLNASSSIVRNLNTTEPLYCFPVNRSESVILTTFNDYDTLCFTGVASVLLLVAAPVGALSLIMMLFTGAIYYYRFEFSYIRYLFNKKESGREKDEVESTGCVYDAFVIFSMKDYSWVAGQLLPNLECEPFRYRLCLHTRDFTIGAAVDKNVTEALKKSRKVICVLTKSFLESKWCQWELSVATHKMFGEERDFITLIELERMKRTNLPMDLEYLMDSRTYLEWPQNPEDQRGMKMCWQRLRHALGKSLVKRTGKAAPEGSVMEL